MVPAPRQNPGERIQPDAPKQASTRPPLAHRSAGKCTGRSCEKNWVQHEAEARAGARSQASRYPTARTRRPWSGSARSPGRMTARRWSGTSLARVSCQRLQVGEETLGVAEGTEAASSQVILRVPLSRLMLPGAEDHHAGGVHDADVGVRESPVARAAAGLWWCGCSWLWVRCRVRCR